MVSAGQGLLLYGAAVFSQKLCQDLLPFHNCCCCSVPLTNFCVGVSYMGGFYIGLSLNIYIFLGFLGKSTHMILKKECRDLTYGFQLNTYIESFYRSTYVDLCQKSKSTCPRWHSFLEY